MLNLKLDANNATRYQAYWDVGTSIEVGINLGILDVIVSAPVEYMNGTSRGLLGKIPYCISRDIIGVFPDVSVNLLLVFSLHRNLLSL